MASSHLLTQWYHTTEATHHLTPPTAMMETKQRAQNEFLQVYKGATTGDGVQYFRGVAR